ncbi:MAG: ABC transporter substrate-binding protein [Propionibacteriaceae bacterium]|nr:ABC transporter substrate-binding protein [Propionibacteriaceae bacterium]
MSQGQFNFCFSRRTLLATAFVAGLAGLAGCSAGDATTPSPTADSTSAAGSTGNAQPAQGGTVTIALDREIPNIDPKENLIGQQPVLILSNAIYEPLMTTADGGTFAPVKAESFEANADGSEWTLVLKSDLVFSNGDPLNADAVIKHVERMSDPAIGASSAGQAEQISTMTASDDRTVVFTLKAPNADFIGQFARQLGMIAHPTAVDEFNFPLGSGPYVVTGFQSGSEIELTRSENYWGEPAVADKLVYKMLPDADSRFQSLQSGDVDIIWTEVTKQMNEARSANLNVNAAPAAVSSLLMNQANRALQDVAVRKGIIQAIDREALNAVVNMGEGVTVDNPYSLQTAVAPTVDYPAYDQAAAEAALKGKNLSLKMIVENRVDTMQRATAVQDMLSKVGVTVEVSPVESANFASTLKAGDFDIADFVTSVFGDPNGATMVFSSDGPYNFTKYTNSTVDSEIAASKTTTDSAKRAEHFKKISDEITKDASAAWYTASNAGIISSSDIAGVPDVSKLTLVSINPKTIGKSQ